MISRIKAFFNSVGNGGSKSKVVTRFAPSPTGFLHAGNYRTAVFSYLYAQQNKGKFILRVEDTDTARSKKEFEDNILESLEWLGLPYDEMYRQSERGELYREYLQKLLDNGTAFVSREEGGGENKGEDKEKTKNTRKEVIRFKNPNKKVKFRDIIRGEIEFDTTELGDFVIAKSITEPIFHFAVVLDDYLMGITHVIRGEDHISNTPRQILIQEALGAPTPVYAHLPLVLAHDRSKLSKRHGAESMTYYRDAGFLPDALLNYMALLGWNPGTTEEIFDLAGLIKAFDLSKVQKGGAIFNEEKLRWINREHLKKAPLIAVATEAKKRIETTSRAIDLKWNVTTEAVAKIIPALVDRINTYGDITKLVESQDLDYYFMEPTYDAISLKWKQDADLAPAKKHLEEIKKKLEEMKSQDWNEAKIKEIVWPYAEANGRGNVLWPFRFALSGKEKSPNPFTLAGIIGREATLKRLNHALKLCAKNS